MTTTEQVKSAITTVATLAEAIRTAGSIPSGHLYAHVCGALDLESYTKAIGILKRAELVRESGNVLTWTGPVLL